MEEMSLQQPPANPFGEKRAIRWRHARDEKATPPALERAVWFVSAVALWLIPDSLAHHYHHFLAVAAVAWVLGLPSLALERWYRARRRREREQLLPGLAPRR